MQEYKEKLMQEYKMLREILEVVYKKQITIEPSHGHFPSVIDYDELDDQTIILTAYGRFCKGYLQLPTEVYNYDVWSVIFGDILREAVREAEAEEFYRV